jgi:hypothetical protein
VLRHHAVGQVLPDARWVEWNSTLAGGHRRARAHGVLAILQADQQPDGGGRMEKRVVHEGRVLRRTDGAVMQRTLRSRRRQSRQDSRTYVYKYIYIYI